MHGKARNQVRQIPIKWNWLLFAMGVIEGVVCLFFLFHVEPDVKNAWLFGYSKTRILLGAVVLFGMGVLGWTAFLAWRDKGLYEALKSFLQNTRRTKIALSIFGFMPLFGLAFLIAFFRVTEPLFVAYLDRLAPIIFWLMAVSAQTLWFLHLSGGLDEDESRLQNSLRDFLNSETIQFSPFRIGTAKVRRWSTVVAPLLLFTLVGITTYRIGQFVIDDAWITFRYAHHLVENGQLTWETASPPVEGYSNFFEVVLVALGMKLGLDPVITARTLGAISTGIILVVLYGFLLQLTGSRWAGLLPLGLYAVHPGLSIHTWAGLETQWFAALGAVNLLVFWLVVRNNERSFDSTLSGAGGAGFDSPKRPLSLLHPRSRRGRSRLKLSYLLTATAFLLSISRTEGVVIGILTLGTALCFQWKTERKPWLRATGIYLMLMAAYTLFRWITFDGLSTGPQLVKLSRMMLWGGLTSREFFGALLSYLEVFPLGWGALVCTLIGVGFVVHHLIKRETFTPARLVLFLALVQLGSLFAVYSRTNMIQNFAARFFMHTAPQQIVITGLILAWLYKSGLWLAVERDKAASLDYAEPPLRMLPLTTQRTNHFRQIALGFLVTVLSWHLVLWSETYIPLGKEYARFVSQYNEQQSSARAIAEVLHRHALEDEWLVTVVDSGITPYFAGMKVLGGDGLTDTTLGQLVPPLGERAAPYAAYVFTKNPAVLMIETYPAGIDEHHAALLCAPVFDAYLFAVSIERTDGNHYNVYLRQDLPTRETITQALTNLRDPQGKWKPVEPDPAWKDVETGRAQFCFGQK